MEHGGGAARTHRTLDQLARCYSGALNLNASCQVSLGADAQKSFCGGPGNERMAVALAATRESLAKLDELSRRIGFGYSIYLLVPVQDIIRGTYGETLATLNGVSPKPVVATAQLFLDSPKDYYYAFDGHLNAKGSKRIAEFLILKDH